MDSEDIKEFLHTLKSDAMFTFRHGILRPRFLLWWTRRYGSFILLMVAFVMAFMGIIQIVANKHHEEVRGTYRDMLSANYWNWPLEMQVEREKIMQKYGFTDDDINPSKLLRVAEGEEEEKDAR